MCLYKVYTLSDHPPFWLPDSLYPYRLPPPFHSLPQPTPSPYPTKCLFFLVHQFSAVFRAKCKINDQQVALKKVKIFEMMDAKSRQDCIREIGQF